MKAYLLTWNPKYWAWENIGKEKQKLQNSEIVETEWDCYSSKPEEGDIFFIVAVGESRRKGIFCTGYITEFVKNVPSLIIERKTTKRNTNRIIGNINYLLNPETEIILDINDLNKNYPEQKWSPQNCGIVINDKYVNDLIDFWENFISKDKTVIGKIQKKEFWEGNSQQKMYSYYERNISARNECIKNNGFICKVCGMNFEDIYGEIGKNYIHVHHITFHSSIKKLHKIDPENDLTTICPNCHSMLHRKSNGKYLSIEDLKSKLKQP
jgi:5-methylcytosine-specific restriction protein A